MYPSAYGAGFRRPSLDPGPPPLEWGRAERAEQGGAGLLSPRHRGFSPPGAQVRSRDGRRGSCSPTPTVVSPGSAIIRGRAVSTRGPLVVPPFPFAALDPTLTNPLTARVNRERSERVKREPHARLQSCLGSAVRSAKQMLEAQKASAAVTWRVLRKREPGAPLVSEKPVNGRMREREMQPPAHSEGTSGDAVPSAPYDPDLSRWRSCCVVAAG